MTWLRSISLTAILGMASAAEPAPPSIVFILADALGYESLSSHGSTGEPTPHLDRLASESRDFSQCHAMPVCTPTRVQLLTGQVHARNDAGFGTLATGVTTFAHLAQRAGYATGMVGKWQLGSDRVAGPTIAGFATWNLWNFEADGLGSRVSRHWKPQLFATGGTPVAVDERSFGPDVQHAWAKQFVTEHRDRPFLLYYATTLPHRPYPAMPSGRPGSFAASLQHLDHQVGDLMSHLDTLGVSSRTVVVFMGDNGNEPTVATPTAQGPVNGGKKTQSVRGTQVPLLIRWPGRIKAGASDELVDSTDLFPTFQDLIGATQAADAVCDGRRLLPHLLGQPHASRPWIPFTYGEGWTQDRDWKLTRGGALFRLTRAGTILQEQAVADGDPAAAAARERLAPGLAFLDKLPYRPRTTQPGGRD